jgi:hypothetical protein
MPETTPAQAATAASEPSPAPSAGPDVDEVALAQVQTLDSLGIAPGEDEADAASDTDENPLDAVEDEPPAPPPDQPDGRGGPPAARRPVDLLPVTDPLTAPLSLLTADRPDLPEPLLADDPADGAGTAPSTPTSKIVLDPLWDMVPEPEPAPPEPDVTQAGSHVVRPVIRRGWLAAAGIVAVSVLAVTVPILAWAADAVDLMAASAPAGTGAAAGLLLVATLLLSAVVFLSWVSTARANVDQLSRVPQRWSPTVARTGWLIPVAGLFIGWQVLRDLWAASDPATRTEALARKPEPLLVTCWLAGLAVSSVVSLAGRFVLGGSPLVDTVAGAAVALAGGCLALTVVRISRWQEPSAAATADGPRAP